MFGCVIDRAAGKSNDASYGGVIDDGAAPLLSHLEQLVLHAVPNAAEVDRVHTFEFFAGRIGSFYGRALDAGVVERGVEAAEGGDSLVDHGFHLGFICDIAADCDGFVSRRAQRVRACASRSFIYIGQYDGSALLCERSSCDKTHTRASAGDESNFVFKPGIHSPFLTFPTYRGAVIERYPDSANFLPDSVAAWIFVHTVARLRAKVKLEMGEVKAARQKLTGVDQRAVEMRAELARKIAEHARAEGDKHTEVPALRLYRRSQPTQCMSAAYEPSLVVFVQGQKRINVGKTIYVCDGSNFLLTSVDLPVVSQVTSATPQKPILGLLLKLEMPVVREILSQHEFHFSDESVDARGMAVGVTSVDLLDACIRLVDLLDTPHDVPFLGNLIQREIIYRLLRSPQGKHLRAIATLGEQSHRTAKAVEWLRMNYAKPLRIEELATMARMGVSTLHHQFRSLTAMSPLQYQKQLRLHVARERMLNEGLDAASAAFEVGYESASQFNREYSRFFGQPPMRDVRARRLTTAGAAAE